MVIRTYFDKNNTIVKNSNVNTGLNPIAELFYGGETNGQIYSRFLFHFDESRLKSLYTGGTLTNLSNLKHTLRMTNTGAFDKELLNGTIGGKNRATSFDLILFKINQDWDNGCGYDYQPTTYIGTNNAFSIGPSNWTTPQTGLGWSGGTGVYSGSPSGITISTQHFDKGNENLEMDVTDYVNGLLTGDTNYGLGIAYAIGYEQMAVTPLQYVGFFNNNTQTFYEPYIETINNQYINDDRYDFYLDKNNKLYLYVNIGGNPTNLDSNPSVSVYDQNGNVLSAYTSSGITHVTKGVYSIDILVPTTNDNDCTMYNDVWSNISINGVTRPDASLNFVIKNSNNYYNIGDSSSNSDEIAISVSGIQNKEKIKRGDIRKVVVSARIPYTINQTQKVSSLKYRLYVTEGTSEYTVIDYQPVEMANNNYYFLIDTLSLIPNTYYLDIQSESNIEITTLKDVLEFEIISQAELRNSQ